MAFTDGFLTITISGGETIERKVRQFATFGKLVSAEGLIPVWTQIGEDLLADFGSNFIGEGRLAFSATPTGRAKAGFGGRSGWPQLAPSTVAERKRLGIGGAHPILWRTGTLAESLMERDAAGNIFEVTPRGVKVGSSIFYAGWHQDGTPHMPARPIVGLTRNRQTALVKRLNDYIFEQVKQAGLNG